MGRTEHRSVIDLTRRALGMAAMVIVVGAATAWAETPTTHRVSVSSTGDQGNDYSFDPAISADGRLIAFASVASTLVSGDTNGSYDVFVRDRKNHVTRRVSVSSTGDQGDGSTFYPAISADGRFVGFGSVASNLVSGDTNGTDDVFVRGPLH